MQGNNEKPRSKKISVLMRRPALVLLAVVFVLVGLYLRDESFLEQPQPQLQASSDSAADAFRKKQSNIQVQGNGVVIAVLRDDTRGIRHQRFILRLPGGTTVLVAHNIDLSSRIDGLKKGDTVMFFGEYEWNDKGGIVHWTHHDPAGRHEDGWLRHDGRVYR